MPEHSDGTPGELYPNGMRCEELKQPSLTTRLRRIFKGQSARERLLTDIDALEARALKYDDSCWDRKHFDHLIARARASANHRDIASGYERLNTAEIQCVSGMPEIEVRVRAVSIEHEIDQKMRDSWRARTSTKLLGDATKSLTDASKVLAEAKAKSGDISQYEKGRSDALRSLRASVAAAVEQRNTHERNSHRKTDRLRFQVFAIGIFLLAQVVVLALGVSKFSMSFTEQPADNILLVQCALLGLLGGTLSSAMSIKTFGKSQAFQEMDSAWIISFARAFIGCAASIPAYLIASAGLVTIGESKTTGILLTCFLAGFSERWFLHVVSGLPRTSEVQSEGKS